MSKLEQLNIPPDFWLLLGAALCLAAFFVPMAMSDPTGSNDVKKACIEQRGNWDDANQQCTFER